jgi:hypothetical protein
LENSQEETTMIPTQASNIVLEWTPAPEITITVLNTARELQLITQCNAALGEAFSYALVMGAILGALSVYCGMLWYRGRKS